MSGLSPVLQGNWLHKSSGIAPPARDERQPDEKAVHGRVDVSAQNVGGELPGRHAGLATNPAAGASAGPETTRARSRVGAQGTYTHAAKVTGNVCRVSRSGASPIRESPTCSGGRGVSG